MYTRTVVIVVVGWWILCDSCFGAAATLQKIYRDNQNKAVWLGHSASSLDGINDRMKLRSEKELGLAFPVSVIREMMKSDLSSMWKPRDARQSSDEEVVLRPIEGYPDE